MRRWWKPMLSLLVSMSLAAAPAVLMFHDGSTVSYPLVQPSRVAL